ncbi:hydrogenase maturation protease [Vibrio hepatarius]|uniref:hydrogenase maturation protease n=1 Tax=Vibrio hepatarius TaxID=171383 RepID=UPI00142DC685|nr:hydrogenase maturation protease [Vibrio hepatarius]NIY84742.1 hydrogenase maturation protease [Vibrio hepatarius]NVJ57817.1 hydrogenase maturation protease [Vibrionaceae bacterium]
MKNTDSPISLNSFDLIYGIGNVGRQDDGLGWAFIDDIEALSDLDATLIRHYQLFFEDVDLLRRHKRVLFVDATKDSGTESFSLSRVKPRLDDSFTSHAITVQTILALCHQVYQVYPDVWLLAIKGDEWELKLGLTDCSRQRLNHAVNQVMTAGVYPCSPALAHM